MVKNAKMSANSAKENIVPLPNSKMIFKLRNILCSFFSFFVVKDMFIWRGFNSEIILGVLVN